MTPTLTRSAVVATTALAASALLLSACSPTEETKAESSASATPTSVDVAALDTGKYPTSPRPEFGKPTDDEVLQVEGQRLAQFVVVPFEIDPDITDAKLPTGPLTGPSSLKMVFAPAVADAEANKQELYGFVSTAGTPASSLRNGSVRALQTSVIRYLTADDARAAASQMAQRAASETGGRQGDPLPGLPDTLVVRSTSAEKKETMMTFTPQINNQHQAYVQYQWYQVEPANESMLVPKLTKAVKEQTALLKQFRGTMTKAEAQEKKTQGSTRPLMDQNKLLIYALPYTDDELKEKMSGGASERAVYGPRGFAHVSSSPALDFTLLTETGAIVATERSNVYRAKDDAGATKIVDTFVSSQKSSGMSPAASPKGLPDVPCLTGSSSSGEAAHYTCFVKNGRYVGEISSENLNDAHQQAAAQYMIFTKADQNAQ